MFPSVVASEYSDFCLMASRLNVLVHKAETELPFCDLASEAHGGTSVALFSRFKGNSRITVGEIVECQRQCHSHGKHGAPCGLKPNHDPHGFHLDRAWDFWSCPGVS